MADMSMMEQKWRIVFKLMDIDKDGALSVKDRDACLAGFKEIYKPEGESAAKLKSDLDVHWNNLLFPGQTPDWSQQLSEDQFVANMASKFESDKQNLIHHMSAAFRHLLSAADNDKSGIFTFDKFFKFHVAFNLAHEVIVRTTFNLIGPNADDQCPFDEVHAFYVELFVGEDKAKFEALQKAYSAIGM